MKIITGSTGTPHVTSNNAGELHQAVFGAGNMVFTLGDALEATLVDNNNITISDGDLMIQGRHALIEPGLTENVEIDTGALGVNRHDLIVARYELDGNTGYESITLQVIKGTESSGEASDPTYNTGDIRTGSTVVDFPLYRVVITGINIVNIEALFEAVPPLEDRNKNLSDLADTDINNPSNGQSLVYNISTHKWENKDTLTNTNISTPKDKDVLIYDSTSDEWTNEHTSYATISGNPISITTDSAQVAFNTDLEFLPIQASGTPTPSSPIPISGYDEVDLAVTGKNLFNKNDSSDVLDGLYIDGGNNKIENWNVTKSVFIRCAPNTTYTVSKIASQRFGIAYTKEYPADEVPAYGINMGGTGTTSLTITTGSDAKYLVVYLYKSDADTATFEQILASVQIELGYTATAYEPYTSPNNIHRNLSETMYGFTYNVERGLIRKTHGIVDLGELSWQIYHHATYGDYFYANISSLGVKSQNFLIVNPNNKLTDYQMVGRTPQMFIDLTACVDGDADNNVTQLQIRDSNYNDGAIFKTSVTGQKFVYELAEPVTYYTIPYELRLLEGLNVLTTNGTTIKELVYRLGEIAKLTDIPPETVNWLGVHVEWNENEIANIKNTKTDLSAIAPVEDGTTASQAYAVGDYFVKDGNFCRCISAISIGSTFTLNTNYIVTKVGTQLTKSVRQTSGTLDAKLRANQTAMATLGDLMLRDAKITNTPVTIGGNASEPEGSIILVFE